MCRMVKCDTLAFFLILSFVFIEKHIVGQGADAYILYMTLMVKASFSSNQPSFSVLLTVNQHKNNHLI